MQVGALLQRHGRVFYIGTLRLLQLLSLHNPDKGLN